MRPVVWNRTLATRHARYQAEGKSTSYRESDAALTAMKKLPDLAWLNEVSSVPLQQALRHQHKAFEAFFQKRARYPRFKSRRSKQSATYTRAAFRWRDGQLTLAKTSAPLRFVWSWPDIDLAALDPNEFKGPASRTLRQEFPHLRSRLPTLWSRSYFVASAGAVSAATVQRYTDTQYERPWRKERDR